MAPLLPIEAIDSLIFTFCSPGNPGNSASPDKVTLSRQWPGMFNESNRFLAVVLQSLHPLNCCAFCILSLQFPSHSFSFFPTDTVLLLYLVMLYLHHFNPFMATYVHIFIHLQDPVIREKGACLICLCSRQSLLQIFVCCKHLYSYIYIYNSINSCWMKLNLNIIHSSLTISILKLPQKHRFCLIGDTWNLHNNPKYYIIQAMVPTSSLGSMWSWDTRLM